jgi:hypothetical protein
VARPEAAERALSFAIAAAIDDLCREMERYHARQEQRQRLTRCILAADRLIRELEDLSRAGLPVPAGWQPRLDRFVAALPAGLDADLRAGMDPNPLLDQVREIEERLYQLKLGEWALAFAQQEC